MRKRRLLPVLCALALLMLFASCGKSKSAPEAYEIGGESIPSLSKALSDGETAQLASEDSSGDPEGTDAQYAYQYDSLSSGGAAAEAYVTLLTGEEMGFQVVDQDNSPAESPDFTAEEGTVNLAKAASTEGELLVIKLSWTAETCDVTVTRPEGEITAKKVVEMTIPDAISFLENLNPSVLGLEGDSMSEYRVYAMDGQVLVNGEPCIRMQVYKNHMPEGSNAIAGVYLLTGDKRHLYRQEKDKNDVVELQIS